MVSNSGRESELERELRRRLFARGLRFRKHVRVLPISRCEPDIAFTRARVAVFVDGCFWHRCPEHATHPRLNGEWWKANSTRTSRGIAPMTRLSSPLAGM